MLSYTYTVCLSVFFALGILYGVRGEFIGDVSETAMDLIFTGHE